MSSPSGGSCFTSTVYGKKYVSVKIIKNTVHIQHFNSKGDTYTFALLDSITELSRDKDIIPQNLKTCNTRR
jgi:hypothetical protein